MSSGSHDMPTARAPAVPAGDRMDCGPPCTCRANIPGSLSSTVSFTLSPLFLLYFSNFPFLCLSVLPRCSLFPTHFTCWPISSVVHPHWFLSFCLSVFLSLSLSASFSVYLSLFPYSFLSYITRPPTLSCHVFHYLLLTYELFLIVTVNLTFFHKR